MTSEAARSGTVGRPDQNRRLAGAGRAPGRDAARAVLRPRPGLVSRLLGVAALGVLAFATMPLNLVVGIAAAAAVLIAVAIDDTVARVEAPLKENA